MGKIPRPTVERCCQLYSFLETLHQKGVDKVQSVELGRLLGVPGFTVRKDLSFISKEKEAARSYNVLKLKELIGGYFGLDGKRKACVVGLGRIGTALLAYRNFTPQGFDIAAGFESSINKLEMIKTAVKLYPDYQMGDVIKRERIEIAMLAVPADAAQRSADILVKAGVKGILNFAPAAVSVPEGVIVKDVDFTNMLREIVAFGEVGRRTEAVTEKRTST